MKFENSSEAIDWMMEHPLKRVYDQYGNYAVYMDKYAPEEFVEAFEDTPLETLD